jgi:CubicO group peptidase (beta-lactamase class C family)
MTKMFAGASVMMLVDEGKLSLDDPVTKYIPQLSKWMVVEERDESHILLKSPTRPVTIRHLLSHTSGLAGSIASPIPFPAVLSFPGFSMLG